MDKMRGGQEGQLDGCGKFIKYSVFFVNFVIFLGGLAILGLGAWLLAERNLDHGSLVGQPLGVAPGAIVVTCGGVIALISFLGCCGAIKEVKCLLATFFIIILIITILLIVGAVLIYKYKGQAESIIKENLQKSIRDGYRTDPEIKKDWDDIQKNFRCCGVDGPGDWKEVIGFPPQSCTCNTRSSECDYLSSLWQRIADNPLGLYYKQGCLEKFKEEIQKVAVPVGAVAITIIIVLILAMVFSCSLFLML